MLVSLQYHCPDIRTMSDAEIARETLRNAPGIEDIEIDWRTSTVKVVTANQDGARDISQRLIDSGFRPAETL